MAVPRAIELRRLGQLVRFYQAAIINTAFGFGIFALLIWLDVNLYVAQILAQLLGMTFNYFTYSRHVFRVTRGAKLRFMAAYGVNYSIGLAFLTLFDLFVHNDYLAGACATVCASLVNYFALKHIVFVERGAVQ